MNNKSVDHPFIKETVKRTKIRLPIVNNDVCRDKELYRRYLTCSHIEIHWLSIKTAHPFANL